MQFCILGAGAWGTAMAVHLERGGQAVTLLPRRQEHAAALRQERMNGDYLPDIPLAPGLHVAASLEEALSNADVLLLACPSKALRSLCETLKVYDLSKVKLLLTLCKGLEQETWLKPCEVVHQVLPGAVKGCLSGPANAREVALGKPTALTLALEESDLTAKVQSALSSASLRIYTSQDIPGVELGACLKNVYAIGAGMSDGLELGDNAKAAYLTRVLNEMVFVGTAMGGQKATFYGLSGFGDLIATAQGKWSRNRSFGEALARGESVEGLLQARKTVVEGYGAARCFHALCTQKGIEAPILEQIYQVLYDSKDPSHSLKALMERSLKKELS